MEPRPKPVSQYKEKQMRVICDFLKVNPETVCTNAQISVVLMASGTMKTGTVNARMVRKLIYHIRNFGILQNVIATDKGYMYTNDMKKLEDYEQRLRREAEKLLRMAERVREWRLMKRDGGQVAMQFGGFTLMMPRDNVFLYDPESETGITRPMQK